MADGSVATARSEKTRTIRSIAGIVVAVLFAFGFAGGVIAISQDNHPLSIVDEHIHFDTAVKATEGEIPFRGSVLGDALIQEWACGVGHEAGPTSVPCGDPDLGPDSIPSGKYSTGYIHYPTYFFAAAGFQHLWSAVTGSADLLNGFRAFSAVTMALGVFAAGVFGWLLRLRGSRLLAVMALPVASSMIVVSGVNVNPASTTVLTGVLVAGTGLLWIRRNRGFLWFALAVLASSAIAVTSSLPAGGFLIAMLVVLIGRRYWPDVAPGWTPRWWQFVLTAVIVLLPVIVWGRVIAARATIDNDVLYGFIPKSGKRDIIVGATQELSSLHTPWRETLGIKAQPDTFVAQVVHAVSLGGPTWITVIVFGGLTLALFFLGRSRPQAAPLLPGVEDTDRGWTTFSRPLSTWTALQWTVLGSLATIVLYPPALRVMNWLNFGFDYPIVDRYSSALAPVLAFALVVLIRDKRVLTRSIAAVATVVALGTVAGAL